MRVDPAEAGRWLREERQRRGFDTVGGFARAIGVDTSRVSSYETGKSAVPDDRAEKIAEVLGIDILIVRQKLGLWVPPKKPPRPAGEVPDEPWWEEIAPNIEEIRMPGLRERIPGIRPEHRMLRFTDPRTGRTVLAVDDKFPDDLEKLEEVRIATLFFKRSTDSDT